MINHKPIAPHPQLYGVLFDRYMLCHTCNDKRTLLLVLKIFISPVFFQQFQQCIDRLKDAFFVNVPSNGLIYLPPPPPRKKIIYCQNKLSKLLFSLTFIKKKL